MFGKRTVLIMAVLPIVFSACKSIEKTSTIQSSLSNNETTGFVLKKKGMYIVHVEKPDSCSTIEYNLSQHTRSFSEIELRVVSMIHSDLTGTTACQPGRIFGTTVVETKVNGLAIFTEKNQVYRITKVQKINKYVKDNIKEALPSGKYVLIARAKVVCGKGLLALKKSWAYTDGNGDLISPRNLEIKAGDNFTSDLTTSQQCETHSIGRLFFDIDVETKIKMSNPPFTDASVFRLTVGHMSAG